MWFRDLRAPPLPVFINIPGRQPCLLIADIERSRTSVITDRRPGSLDSCATLRRFHMEQACRRPSFPDPLGVAPPSSGHTLHHDSPDPPGDPISASEADVVHGRADAMGRSALRAGSASWSPPTRQTSLLGGSPSDPWEGHRRKTRSALRSDGSPSPATTTNIDVDHPYSHA
jgi:hypothetical protein